MSSRKRIRAHANPFSTTDAAEVPVAPGQVDWSQHYLPNAVTKKQKTDVVDSEQSTQPASLQPTIVDLGCGFGGLTVALSTAFPDQYSVGLELRDRVAQIVQKRLAKLRADAQKHDPISVAYGNTCCLQFNAMKYLTHLFQPHSINALYICFPDPHFKRANHRRRVITPQLLSYYAYLLPEGGVIYTITDVHELHQWMVQACDDHPSFERIPNAELEAANDLGYNLIQNATEEGQKVSRIHGNKFIAVYRRLSIRGKASSSTVKT